MKKKWFDYVLISYIIKYIFIKPYRISSYYYNFEILQIFGTLLYKGYVNLYLKCQSFIFKTSKYS